MHAGVATDYGFPQGCGPGEIHHDDNGDRWELGSDFFWWRRAVGIFAKDDPVSPSHYQGFSNGAEVIDITENLNSNGGQAVQYIARSTRLDGRNKGNPIEDLKKAAFFIQRELARQEGKQ